MELAKLCRRKKVPAILLSGFAKGNPGGLFQRIYSATENHGGSFEEIRRTAPENLRKAAEKMPRDLIHAVTETRPFVPHLIFIASFPGAWQAMPLTVESEVAL